MGRISPPTVALNVPSMSVPLFRFIGALLHPTLAAMDSWSGIPYEYLRLGIVWCLALVFGYFLRWFLIQFAGDVAIYTSSYKVSAFDEIRDKIRKTVLDAARGVYRASDPVTGWSYDHLIFVGHSLGSVIAYDTLNALITEDNCGPQFFDVAKRTWFFLTFGSPLDKIAFIFESHSTKTHDFREKAAEETQPLIQDYRKYRPKRWVNIWSPMDIISGRLKYYDDTSNQTSAQRIANKLDKDAWVPFAAHTEYWQNELFAKELYDAILSAP